MTIAKPKSQRHGEGAARDAILRAAETVFADHGYDGVSLRQIAQEADVPVGLVSYHFEGKLGLYKEVFRVQSPSASAQRQAGLALAKLEDDPKRRLEMIVKAVLMPMLSLRSADEGGRKFGLLLAREANDPKNRERGIIQEVFDPVARATIALLKQTLPQRTDAEIIWGFQMIIGTMVYIMADSGRSLHLSDGACDPNDIDSTIRHIVSLLLHGLGGAA